MLPVAVVNLRVTLDPVRHGVGDRPRGVHPAVRMGAARSRLEGLGGGGGGGGGKGWGRGGGEGFGALRWGSGVAGKGWGRGGGGEDVHSSTN